MSVEICQLPRNSAETTGTISPEQIEVMKLKRYSKAMCNKHVHSTMTSIRSGRGQWLGGRHGECGTRAYNGGLVAEPPAGSRGRAPVQGSGGRSPPEAESILVIGCPTEPANLAPLVKFSK